MKTSDYIILALFIGNSLSSLAVYSIIIGYIIKEDKEFYEPISELTSCRRPSDVINRVYNYFTTKKIGRIK